MKVGFFDTREEYIVFGASFFGQTVVKSLQSHGITVKYVCDNGSDKWGASVSGVPVISPNELAALDKEICVIIASKFHQEITKQLEEMKFLDIRYYPLESYANDKGSTIWKSEHDLLSSIAISVQNINSKQLIVNGFFATNKEHLHKGEKIRMVFLFQTIQHWASWESVWEECANDSRLDARIVVFEYSKMYRYHSMPDVEKAYTNTKPPGEFLKQRGIEFTNFENFDLDLFRPHIILLQQPHEITRPFFLSKDYLKTKGIRLVYIPYGIELPLDSPEYKIGELNKPLVNDSWRTYTISAEMKDEYVRYTDNFGTMVRATGHPKFDGLYHAERYPLPNAIKECIKKRKLGFWNIHFPLFRYVADENKYVWTTFSFEEYEQFAMKIAGFKKNVFFIASTHPAFHARCAQAGIGEKAKKFIELLNGMDNIAYIHGEDYRPSLINADFIMTDHSALSADAGATMKPVLFLDYPNRINKIGGPVGNLIENYYHGSTAEDVAAFIEMCIKDEDPLKEARDIAFRKAVPYFDGLCGHRIKEDIINSLYLEECVGEK